MCGSCGLIVDIDGTLIQNGAAIAGSTSFLCDARNLGFKLMFLTNRTATSKSELLSELSNANIYCEASQVLTAAEVASDTVARSKVFVVGENGLRKQIGSRATLVTRQQPDYVVVGLDRQITYEKIERAARFVRAGAKFLATNLDSYFVGAQGISPGAGAVVAAVSTAAGARPTVIGKPSVVILERALEALGTYRERTLMIGDTLETDIHGGQKAGISTILFKCQAENRGQLVGATNTLDCQNGISPSWVCNSFEEMLSIIMYWRKGLLS